MRQLLGLIQKWSGLAFRIVSGAFGLFVLVTTVMDWIDRPEARLYAYVRPTEYQLPPGVTVTGPTPKGQVQVLVRNGGEKRLENVSLRIPQAIKASHAVITGDVIDLGPMRQRDETTVYFWTRDVPSVDMLRRQIYLAHKDGEGDVGIMVYTSLSSLERHDMILSFGVMCMSLLLAIDSIFSSRRHDRLWESVIREERDRKRLSDDKPPPDSASE
jgi:hypothetical protein